MAAKLAKKDAMSVKLSSTHRGVVANARQELLERNFQVRGETGANSLRICF